MIGLNLNIFGDSSSGLGALGFSASSFVIQLITFVLAYLALRKWAFGPILKVLRERRETIAKGVNLGEALQKEKVELEASVAKELAEARAKADGIIAEAHESAKSAIRGAEASAEAKAELILKEAKEKTTQEMQRAKRRMEGEIVGLVSDATEAIIKEKIDVKKDAKLVEQSLAQGLSR